MEDIVDDLLTEAQDAFFIGDLPAVVKYCEEALEKSPREKDAFELLTLALMQSQPPNYKEAVAKTLQWGKTCGNDWRQLKRLLKVAYHSEDKETVHHATTKLLEDPNGTLVCPQDSIQTNYFPIRSLLPLCLRIWVTISPQRSYFLTAISLSR